jgi:hypothetical protein
VVAAEADECSRWIIMCLSCCAGVSIIYIFLSLAVKYLDDYIIMVIPVVLLGITGGSLFALSILQLFELCAGRYIDPRRSLADDVLMFLT